MFKSQDDISLHHPHTDVIRLDILDQFVFEVDTLFHNFEIPMFVISFDDVFVLKQ